MFDFIKKIKPAKVLIIIFLAAIFTSAIVPITDGDTGYHLKTGEYIVTHKAVPLYDIFSYTALNARWIAHYWLADVIFYLVYAVGGLWGLIIFVAAIAVLAYGVLFKTARASGSRSEIIAVSLGLFTVFMVRIWSLWVVRPQIFGFLIGAILLYFLEKWRLSRNRKWLYLTVPTLLIWANVHASVVLGIALVILYVGLFALRNIKRPKLWMTEAVIAVLAALSTLINPNGYKILVYNFIISPIVSFIGIFEWRSLIVYLGPGGSYKAWLVFGFICFSFGLIVWRLVKLGKASLGNVTWEWVFLALAALLLPILSVRHVGFFPILIFPVFAWCLEGLFPKLSEFFDRKSGIYVIGALGLALAVFGVFKIPSLSLDKSQLPEGASQFILEHKLQEPLYNTISHGSYLIWKLWPEYKVFVDGRSEVYSKDFWKDYKTIAEYGDGWQELFDKYNFNTVILTGTVPEPGKTLIGADLILAYNLAQKSDFVLVYWDDASLVLVRNIPANREVIKNYGYKFIGPYIAPQYIFKKDAQKAAQEIEHALQTAPDSEVIQRYAQAFLETH
jgi:hypothetical protein